MSNAAQQYDVIIIGAGAAGLMCAVEAGKRGRKVLLLDRAKAVGEKIRISGGGRCNFTNLGASPAQYLSQQEHFCTSALKRYTQHDFIAMVERHKISYHEKTLGQLFCDDSSKQIIQMFLDECAAAGVEIRTKTEIAKVEKDGEQFAVRLEQDAPLRCDSLVIATGGPSIPKMGATGWGYEVARQFGLAVTPTRAALVPFTLGEHVLKKMKPLAGVSLKAEVRCNGTAFREGMLFTHRGLSGPAILQVSSYWKEGQEITVNFLPDEKELLATLKALRESGNKQEVQTVLAGYVPKKLAQYLCEEHGWTGRFAECSNKRLQAMVEALQSWQIKPSGTEGYRTAEVTLGGVDTQEVSSKSFEAKQVAGLYFIGEVLDVTGWLGGYNFQWAWASGHAAGQYV